MKTVLTMLLILGVSTISSANLVEQWNFGSEGNFVVSLIQLRW